MTTGADEEMRIAAAQRDPSRFGDLYEENFFRVYAYVSRRVGDRHQAEDLTSDVFREALAAIGKFEWRGAPFLAWLLRIASRLIADHYKRSGRETGNPLAGPEPPSTDEIERSAMLFQLVERLPEAQFRVIQMRFVEQKSIREIAAELGRSEGAVKQLQLRAIENLRAQMEVLMPDRDRAEQLDRAIESGLMGEALAMGADPELKSMAGIVRSLRHLPGENFRAALKNELLRRAAMSTSTSTAAGFRTVTPFIIHAQAPEMIDFILKTFGAEELKRKTGELIGFYSEVRIGDSLIMIGGGTAARWGNLPSALHVYVDDCDAVYRRALDAGAVTLMGELGRPADRPYGERSAFVQDAFGNYWYIATRSGPSGAQHTGAVLPYLHPEDARKQIDFLRRAFGAEEMTVAEAGGRILHGALRIGDAVVELGEPEDRAGIPTNGMFLFVEDVDAVYARALEAGATSYRPPEDLSYGMRAAIVRDPAGYLWWPARWLRE